MSGAGEGSLAFKGCTLSTWGMEMAGQGLGPEVWGPGPRENQSWREGQIPDKCESPGARWEVESRGGQTLHPTSAPQSQAHWGQGPG